MRQKHLLYVVNEAHWLWCGIGTVQQSSKKSTKLHFKLCTLSHILRSVTHHRVCVLTIIFTSQSHERAHGVLLSEAPWSYIDSDPADRALPNVHAGWLVVGAASAAVVRQENGRLAHSFLAFSCRLILTAHVRHVQHTHTVGRIPNNNGSR